MNKVHYRLNILIDYSFSFHGFDFAMLSTLTALRYSQPNIKKTES